MATFITIVPFMPHGVTNIRDTCERAAAFKVWNTGQQQQGDS
jgi:hypothetical protein